MIRSNISHTSIAEFNFPKAGLFQGQYEILAGKSAHLHGPNSQGIVESEDFSNILIYQSKKSAAKF